VLRNFKTKPAETGIIALIFCLAFGIFVQPQYDPDFWWSLRIGQQILLTQTVPHLLPWTFTVPSHTYLSQEWATDTLYAWLWEHVGMGAVILVTAIVTWVGLCVMYRCVPRHVSLLGKGAAVLVLLLAGDPTWGPRAQMFTFLGVALLIWIIREHWRSTAWRWAVAPIVCIWGQFHGGFTYGLGILFMYLAGVTIQAWWTKEKDATLSRWWLTWLVAALAAMVNPIGVGVYGYLFELVSKTSVTSLVQEWQSPNFHDPRMLAVIVLIVLTGAGFTSYRRNLAEFLIVTSSLVLALEAIRNVVEFAIIALPTAAVGADVLISAVRNSYGRKPQDEQRAGPEGDKRHLELWFSFVCCAIGIALAVGFAVPRLKSPSNDQLSSSYPVPVLRWVCSHPDITRIFGPPDTTGWLLAAMDPTGAPNGACTRARVEEFGEYDLIGKKVLQETLEIQNGGPDTFTILNNWHVQAVWTVPNTTLALLLSLEPARWHVAFNNHGDEIFLRAPKA